MIKGITGKTTSYGVEIGEVEQTKKKILNL